MVRVVFLAALLVLLCGCAGVGEFRGKVDGEVCLPGPCPGRDTGGSLPPQG